ncbi:MAG: T9SS type A sorting domain-containing protein [Williamsia sp.]|nr:T9SS type A sorting domain-containing protein [Williamsia sp.]
MIDRYVGDGEKKRKQVNNCKFKKVNTIQASSGTYALSGTELVSNSKEVGTISSIYPNPVKGQVTIQLSKAPLGLVQVQVFNQAGAEMFSKKIYHENSGDFKANLDLQKLPNGSYILMVVLHGNVYLHKLLLQ